MKNEELIKALRYHADATIHDCDGCPYQTIHKTNGMCADSMISDAADAIEAKDRLLDQSTERCEELRKQLREAHENYENHIAELEEQLPTIDAVEVVRCKDCIHRDVENGLCEGRGWPMQLVPDDGFCDKGERSKT